MDIQTILISIAGIVATGSLSKVGVNITENVLLKSKQLLALIKNKLPRIATVLQDNEQPVDYDRVYKEVEAVAQSDPQMKKLLHEMKQAVLNDREVAHRVEYELNKPNAQLPIVIEMPNVIENCKGINTIGNNNSIAVQELNL